ncbi:MAG TPA: type III pantothenate kinase [Candidatus Aminicenantes bacterium]|nr:type III pantothenate kinase [Candidatus Aminicenantes bacterium]HRY64131.1 type III pantothenate kinase [Candidatus Aminicenantes bacterium]HRZ71044.1 type III pantothenate kinase [Candidatus Aminicenantes bacterium]
MLMAFDIGNTTIAVGLFRGRKLVRSWKLKTDSDRTSDEYGLLINGLLRSAGSAAGKVDAAVISSVVPPLTPVIEEVCRTSFGVEAGVVGPGLKTGMPILYENPLEVGADRITASIAAFEKYGGPVIVLDFGTATTFDSVSAKGEYLGGAIAPGVRISAEALYLKTAKLPRIEIRKPKRAVGRTTVASMQSGLYFGYIGMVSRIIGEIRREIGPQARVVATGGFGGQIASELAEIEAYEPDLVLEGLRIIHERTSGVRA